MKTSYLFLAEGFEEIEALATVDVLRRAGMNVETVSISGQYEVMGAHNIEVIADELIEDILFEEAQWLICPGGMPGAANLAACETLTDALKAHNAEGGGIAAICAAPAVVLAPLKILRGKNATCYPSFEGQLEKYGANHVDLRVVVDENIITANGPASALLFALEIVTQQKGKSASEEVADGMLLG